MAVEALQDIRTRLLPLLQAAAMQYENRVPPGYPNIVDTPQTGTIGIELDPSFALYIVQDDKGLGSRLYRRAPRTDARGDSGWQKYGGVPFSDRRPLDRHVSDQELRNMIAELMSWYNYQPGIIYITDD